MGPHAAARSTAPATHVVLPPAPSRNTAHLAAPKADLRRTQPTWGRLQPTPAGAQPTGGPVHPSGGPVHPSGGPVHPSGGPVHPTGGPHAAKCLSGRARWGQARSRVAVAARESGMLTPTIARSTMSRRGRRRFNPAKWRKISLAKVRGQRPGPSGRARDLLWRASKASRPYRDAREGRTAPAGSQRAKEIDVPHATFSEALPTWASKGGGRMGARESVGCHATIRRRTPTRRSPCTKPKKLPCSLARTERQRESNPSNSGRSRPNRPRDPVWYETRVTRNGRAGGGAE